jgi:hypothetical protein
MFAVVGNSESPSFKDDAAATEVATTIKQTKEEDEMCVHPRKRKIRNRTESTEPGPQEEEDSPVQINSNFVTEKVPNPFEIYISLRKKVGFCLL